MFITTYTPAMKKETAVYVHSKLVGHRDAAVIQDREGGYAGYLLRLNASKPCDGYDTSMDIFARHLGVS